MPRTLRPMTQGRPVALTKLTAFRMSLVPRFRPLIPQTLIHKTLNSQSHPMALTKLAAFFHDAYFQKKKKLKPLVIIGPANRGGTCLVVGYNGQPRTADKQVRDLGPKSYGSVKLIYRARVYFSGLKLALHRCILFFKGSGSWRHRRRPLSD